MLKFIDLFAGIGGMRLGFEPYGACVFACELDKYATRTYHGYFPTTERAEDIRKVNEHDVPKHDILLAGFPCQPFSLAGVSKRNSLGMTHGFADTTKGTLFFDVARIIAAKRPRAFLLENVKNLLSHDGGKTFEVIASTLRDELGYELHYKVIDASPFVPQHRKRIYMIGFREPSTFSWDDVHLPAEGPKLSTILHRLDGTEPLIEHDGDRFFHDGRVCPNFTVTQKTMDYLNAHAERHKASGNGFGFGLFGPEDVARTLMTRYYKDGSEILIRQDGMLPRRLTPRECARLMGFPDDFPIYVSNTQAYKQFGNSVVVPMIRSLAKAIVSQLE